MIIKENENGFQSSGTQSQNSFTIKANAKAFKILSDGLYSNKIKSIIREISSNAYDAHVAAGKKEKPFYVKFPTNLDNIFSVRDYGIGLSKEDVQSIYTTYFESTKTDSNDYIGALGLGSKSPFSYTDTFNVTSYFEGVKCEYIASLVNGVPNIILVDESETEEVNGIKVSFPVKDRDFSRFERYGKEVFKNFKVRPETNFNFDFKDHDDYIFIENKNFIIRKQHNGMSDSSLYAIQGNVSYPIDTEQIKLPEELEPLKYYSNYYQIEIDFPIGDLDVSASRESLSYDEETKENINKAILKTVSKIKFEIIKKIKKSPTLFDAKLIYKKSKKIEFIEKIINKTKITYRDINVTSNEKIVLKGEKIKIFSNEGKKRGETVTEHIYEDSFLTKKEPLFVIKDKRVGVTDEILGIVSENKHSKVILVEKNNTIIRDIEAQIGKKLPSVLASEIKIKPVKGERKNYSKNSFGAFTKYGTFYSIESSTIDDNVVKYYIPTIRKTPIRNFVSEVEVKVDKLREIFQTLTGESAPSIYAVRKSGIKEVKVDENWINLIDYLKDKAKEIKKITIYEDTSYGYYKGSGKRKVIDILSKVSSDKIFKDFAKSVDKTSKNDIDLRRTINLISSYLIPNFVERKIIKKSNKEIVSELFKKYPLVEYVLDNMWSKNKDVISSELTLYVTAKEESEENFKSA